MKQKSYSYIEDSHRVKGLYDAILTRDCKDAISLSVITPTFNASSYVNRFFKYLKLLGEVVNNVELILIDGGSYDNTLELAKDLFEKEKLCGKIVLAKGADVSTARNLGLLLSSGKYVIFFDIDDIPLPRGFAELLQLIDAHNANVAFGKLMVYDKVLKKIVYVTPIKNLQIMRGEDLLKHIIRSPCVSYRNSFDLRVYQAIYSRDFLRSRNILFTWGSVSHEDFEFLVKILTNSDSILLVPRYVYIYLANPQSVRINRVHDGLETLKRVETYLDQAGISKPWGKLVILQDISSMLNLYLRCLLLDCKIEEGLQKFIYAEYNDLLANYIEYVRMLMKCCLSRDNISLAGLFKVLKYAMMILPYQYLAKRRSTLHRFTLLRTLVEKLS